MYKELERQDGQDIALPNEGFNLIYEGRLQE